MPPPPAGYTIVRRLPSQRRAIYEAIEDRAPHRRVALNVARAPHLDPEDPACPLGWRAADDISRIVDVARRLDHDAIVRLVADHTESTYPAVALAWCDGRPLDADAVAPLASGARLDIAIQVADLVAHAHHRHVVLRDLKPTNLLLSYRSRVTLVDLDLAVHGAAVHGGPAGTWRWTAPEQALFGAVDHRADLYALGTLLYFLFTGRPPWPEGRAALREQFEDRGLSQADLPEAYRSLVNGLIQADPARRVASADDVLGELRRLQANEPPRRWPLHLTRGPSWLRGFELDEHATADQRVAAAEHRLAIHDLDAAAAHAELALALTPGAPAALLCAASVRLAAGDRATGHRLLDRLIAALPPELDDAFTEKVIARLVSAFRPEDALPIAAHRSAALDYLAGKLREWLHHVTYGMSRDEQAAQAVRQPEAVDTPRILTVLAAALELRGRFDAHSPHAAVLPRCRELRVPEVSRVSRVRAERATPLVIAPDTVDEAVAAAEQLLASGDLEAADTLLGRWIVSDEAARRSPALFLTAARVMIERGRWRDARDAAAHAIGLNAGSRPDLDFDGYLQLALAHLQLDQAELARTFAARCLAIRRDVDVAWDLALAADEHERSAQLADAIAACPSSARLHRRLALAAWRVGAVDQALDSARVAVVLAPDEPRYWQTRGELLLCAGRGTQALLLADAFARACGPSPACDELRLHAWLLLDEPRRAVVAGCAVLAAHAERAATWESLAIAWLALGCTGDALNAALAFERLATSTARRARLSSLVAFGQRLPLHELCHVAREAADATSDLDTGLLHAIALQASGDVAAARAIVTQIGHRDPSYAPDVAVRAALVAAAPALAWAGTLCVVALGPVTPARARRAHRLAAGLVLGPDTFDV